MKEIKAYQCDFCEKKYYKYKSSAYKHERNCTANLVNKACRTCANFHIEWNTVYVAPRGDQNYGDADYEEKQFWCNAKEKQLENPGDWQINCTLWKQGERHF